MKVYLDNNATTKVDEEVVKAMMPYFSEYYGNPFSLHLFGNETGLAVTQARQTIADILKAKPNEIIFTASGSEADNLAIRGIAKLSASLPEAVNIISLGFAFKISAIVCLASVTASPVSFPNKCRLNGFP